MVNKYHGNKGNFPEGQSNKPYKFTAADNKFFGTTEKAKRKSQIEKRVKGDK